MLHGSVCHRTSSPLKSRDEIKRKKKKKVDCSNDYGAIPLLRRAVGPTAEDWNMCNACGVPWQEACTGMKD